MKILHTADWHLGKKLGSFSRIEEQRVALNELCEIARRERVDVVLIAGDLFDSYNPSNEATDLFYSTIQKLSEGGKRLVVAIAGNHDSADFIDAPQGLARTNGIILSGDPRGRLQTFELESGLGVIKEERGFIEVNLPRFPYPLRLLLTPYASEARLRTYLGDRPEENIGTLLGDQWRDIAMRHCDNRGVNMLVTHLFMMNEGLRKQFESGEIKPYQMEPEDEKPMLHLGGVEGIDIDQIPEQIQYTALGHLHQWRNVGSVEKPVIYSGSLLSYRFDDQESARYAALITIKPDENPQVEKISLVAGKPLLRKRFESGEAALAWLQTHPDCYVELTMVSDTYIDAALQKALYKTHKGIAAIIPEITGQRSFTPKVVKLDQSIPELFIEYVTHKSGQKPSGEMLDLLNEIIGGA